MTRPLPRHTYRLVRHVRTILPLTGVREEPTPLEEYVF